MSERDRQLAYILQKDQRTTRTFRKEAREPATIFIPLLGSALEILMSNEPPEWYRPLKAYDRLLAAGQHTAHPNRVAELGDDVKRHGYSRWQDADGVERYRGQGKDTHLGFPALLRETPMLPEEREERLHDCLGFVKQCLTSREAARQAVESLQRGGGREEEIEAVGRWLRNRTRLVHTVCAASGIGRTALLFPSNFDNVLFQSMLVSSLD